MNPSDNKPQWQKEGDNEWVLVLPIDNEKSGISDNRIVISLVRRPIKKVWKLTCFVASMNSVTVNAKTLEEAQCEAIKNIYYKLRILYMRIYDYMIFGA